MPPFGLRRWRAVYGSWLAVLWYLLNPLFCERARGRYAVLEPFAGKVFFNFFVSGHLMVWVAVSYELLRLSSGHLGLDLTLRTNDAACASAQSSLDAGGSESLSRFSTGNCG